MRDGRDLAWHFAVGRIGARRAAAAGPFDGLSLNRRLAPGMRLGAFGGFAPSGMTWASAPTTSWSASTCQLDPAGTGGTGVGLTVLPASGVTAGRDQPRVRHDDHHLEAARGLSLLQAAELDFNRGWRRKPAPRGASLISVWP